MEKQTNTRRGRPKSRAKDAQTKGRSATQAKVKPAAAKSKPKGKTTAKKPKMKAKAGANTKRACGNSSGTQCGSKRKRATAHTANGPSKRERPSKPTTTADQALEATASTSPASSSQNDSEEAPPSRIHGIEPASSTDGDGGGKQSTGKKKVPEVPLAFLQKACSAMQSRCRDELEATGRKLDRRSHADPYKLANYQKCIWADRYVAARRRDEELDYVGLSTKTQFKVFQKNPQALAAHHDSLLKLFHEGYEEATRQQEVADQLPVASVQALLESSCSSLLAEIKQTLCKERELKKQDLIRALQEERELNQAARQLAATRHQAISSADNVRSPTATSAQIVMDGEEDSDDLCAVKKKLRLQLFAEFEKMARDLQAQHQVQMEEKSNTVQELTQKLAEEKSSSASLRDELSARDSDADKASNKASEVAAHGELMNEMRKTTQDLVNEKAISSGRRKKAAGVERTLLLVQQNFKETAATMKKNHDDQLKEKDGSMNAVMDKVEKRTIELDEVAKRQQEEAIRLRNLENKLQDEESRLQNKSQQQSVAQDQIETALRNQEEEAQKAVKAEEEQTKPIEKNRKVLEEIRRRGIVLKVQFQHNGLAPAVKSLHDQIGEERKSTQQENDRVKEEVEFVKGELQKLNLEKIRLNEMIERLSMKVETYSECGVTEKKIEDFTENNSSIQDGSTDCMRKMQDFVHGNLKKHFPDAGDDFKWFKDMLVDFWKKRCVLIHDKTGRVIGTMDHRRFLADSGEIKEMLTTSDKKMQASRESDGSE